MAFDTEKYIRDKIKAHPELELVEVADSHAGIDGHIFIIGRTKDKTTTAALSTSGLAAKAKRDGELPALIDARIQMVFDVLSKEAK